MPWEAQEKTRRDLKEPPPRQPSKERAGGIFWAVVIQVGPGTVTWTTCSTTGPKEHV